VNTVSAAAVATAAAAAAGSLVIPIWPAVGPVSAVPAQAGLHWLARGHGPRTSSNTGATAWAHGGTTTAVGGTGVFVCVCGGGGRLRACLRTCMCAGVRVSAAREAEQEGSRGLSSAVAATLAPQLGRLEAQPLLWVAQVGRQYLLGEVGFGQQQQQRMRTMMSCFVGVFVGESCQCVGRCNATQITYGCCCCCCLCWYKSQGPAALGFTPDESMGKFLQCHHLLLCCCCCCCCCFVIITRRALQR
jgi:hypothetical protein